MICSDHGNILEKFCSKLAFSLEYQLCCMHNSLLNPLKLYPWQGLARSMLSLSYWGVEPSKFGVGIPATILVWRGKGSTFVFVRPCQYSQLYFISLSCFQRKLIKILYKYWSKFLQFFNKSLQISFKNISSSKILIKGKIFSGEFTKRIMFSV